MKRLQETRRAVTLLLVCIILAGCGGAAYRVHPGSGGYVSGPSTPLQTFISQSYDTLVGANGVIVQTRADFLAGKFPTSISATVRTSFNALVIAYNTSDDAWRRFNDAATANPASVSQATLAASFAVLEAALSNLLTAKGGN